MNDKNLYLFVTTSLEASSPPVWIPHVIAEPNWGVEPDVSDKEALVREFNDLLDGTPQTALGPQGVDLDLSGYKTLTKYLRRIALRAERRSQRVVVMEITVWL